MQRRVKPTVFRLPLPGTSNRKADRPSLKPSQWLNLINECHWEGFKEGRSAFWFKVPGKGNLKTVGCQHWQSQQAIHTSRLPKRVAEQPVSWIAG